MKKKTTLISLVFIVGILASSYVMFIAGKEVYRGRNIEHEVDKLKVEAERIKTDNESLREKIAYLDTDQFREKIAKEKLNLKRDGEKVIEIRSSLVLGEEVDSAETDVLSNDVKEDTLENYKKWWRQFFSY